MLYHISLEDVSHFSPRIPPVRLDNEDNSTKRICFSESIEGALSAIEGSIKLYSGMLILAEKYNCPPILHIYSINEDDVGSKYIINNEIVSTKVVDAFRTKEVWVTRDININEMEHKIVVLKDFVYNPIELNEKAFIYYINKIFYKKATNEEILLNKKFWNSLFFEIKKELNKELNNENKREIISFFSNLI